jgi:HlyD family secretion protein
MPLRRSLFVALTITLLLLAGLGAAVFWLAEERPESFRALVQDMTGDRVLPEGFASSNGRVEATEVDVASKLAGRLTEVLVREGDQVEAGSVVARLDTESLDAQLRQARAELARAQAERDHAEALVAQRESELDFARDELQRMQRLATQGPFVSEESVDQARTSMRSSEAAMRAARVRVTATAAAIDAAEAGIERIRVEIRDTELRAPRSGRVLYRLAEPGEVVGVGGKVLTLLDLNDVYMVIHLPTTVVGRVPLNAEARIVFDAAPEYVIPAHVSFVAARAQFTPKQVETESARERLSFRVKVQIDSNLLARYQPLVKAGLPGVAYIRLDSQAAWPEHLQTRLPQWNSDPAPPPSN